MGFEHPLNNLSGDIMIKLNLETIVRQGEIADLQNTQQFRFDDTAFCLVAVVAKKERLTDRGLRGKRIHWFWKAYLLKSYSETQGIANAVSAGKYQRIVFMFIKSRHARYTKTADVILDTSESLDEAESTPDLFRKLKGRFNCE